MELSNKQIASIFKALSDENRIQILKLLHSGENCACQLLEEMDITQPTLSHHMKILCDCGIVTGRKDGKWMHYSISCEGVRTVKAVMKNLLPSQNTPADCECSEHSQKGQQ